MAASAPSRLSPAGLACPSARPVTVSPGDHSRTTWQVTRPAGDRSMENPVKRRRSRLTTVLLAALVAPASRWGFASGIGWGKWDPGRTEERASSPALENDRDH